MSGITYLYLQNCGMTFIVPLVAKITLEGNFVENPLFFFVSGIMVTACCLVKFCLILENIKKAQIMNMVQLSLIIVRQIQPEVNDRLSL